MPISASAPQGIPMQRRIFNVRFLTPAFLGNAGQDGQWRTPPFKHLLREWWRVVWAEDHQWSNDIDALRRAEGELFGSAADGMGHRSRVRLRLDRWDEGRLAKRDWQEVGTVTHPEVGHAVGAGLYLGYGPLDRKSKTTTLKSKAAIQAGESAGLRLAFPDADAPMLDRALALMNAFGALGGRSRNGWGSLSVESAPALDALPLRDWRDCLDRDWAHAIGRDGEGALIWQTEPFDDWRQLMRCLAEIKIGLRTQFKFHTVNNAPRPEARHWLSYPVTHHSVKPWDDAVKQKEAKKLGLGNRIPNSLRFKVVADNNGKLRGRIFHMPCLPPRNFNPDVRAIEQVWSQVHAFLDGATGVVRVNP